ncbi:uncharacterized protein [Drosophila kikkawai]|uniref:Uncharacterized protein n=1 Tax=Drosophila kikkawai TaxID=30033 RepID=A0A6P4J505_DROKI|nr:uncharacterized protein LOC108080294 [Drosophila kikkawai]
MLTERKYTPLIPHRGPPMKPTRIPIPIRYKKQQLEKLRDEKLMRQVKMVKEKAISITENHTDIPSSLRRTELTFWVALKQLIEYFENILDPDATESSPKKSFANFEKSPKSEEQLTFEAMEKLINSDQKPEDQKLQEFRREQKAVEKKFHAGLERLRAVFDFITKQRQAQAEICWEIYQKAEGKDLQEVLSSIAIDKEHLLLELKHVVAASASVSEDLQSKPQATVWDSFKEVAIHWGNLLLEQMN